MNKSDTSKPSYQLNTGMSYMYDQNKTKTYKQKAFRVTSPSPILHIVMRVTFSDYRGGSVNDHL